MNKYLTFFLMLFSMLNLDADNIKLTSQDILMPPLPLPYNNKNISSRLLDSFINEAINENLQPVIIFGGNWCPDCRILDGTLELPTVKKFLNEHYKIMHIDIGRYDKNMELMSHLKIEQKKGVPRVVIFNFQKEILNSSTSSEWTTARDRKQQEIFNYFQKYVVKN
ncbi:MAG: thioredoxin family protein [Gammaproteobacteria bacterium]